MPPKRSNRAGAKEEIHTRPPSVKSEIDISELKTDLWDHYQSINLKIRPPEGDDVLENQHHRDVADEEKEHEVLKQLLKRYENIYDHDYDIDNAKKVFKKNSKNNDEDEYTPLIWAIKLSSKDNIRYLCYNTSFTHSLTHLTNL